jgi:hypothetical protein
MSVPAPGDGPEPEAVAAPSTQRADAIVLAPAGRADASLEFARTLAARVELRSCSTPTA